MRTACLLALAMVPLSAASLAAQHFSVGPQIAFGDYKEVSPDLHYRGGGIALKATFSWKKMSAEAVASKLQY